MTFTEVHENSQRHLHDIANNIAAARKVVVITGAGISTNCGIPDFRSETGLYRRIGSQSSSRGPPNREASKARPNPPVTSKGKDLFDSNIWRDETSTATFLKFIASLRDSIQAEVRQTSATHRFIRTLRDQKKLVRCYTQNIDGLEQRVGLCSDLERGKGNRSRFGKRTQARPPNAAGIDVAGAFDRGCEVVPLHGDLKSVRCTLCQQIRAWDTSTDSPRFLQGKSPHCTSCAAASESRQDRGKRGTKVGTMRPNIVLYGEEHPVADVVGKITTHDLSLSPDLLLVMGTSLHVHGLKTLVREFAKAVHARPNKRGKVIFVNGSKPAESAWKDVFDYWVGMDCDQWVGRTRAYRPDIWQHQARIPGHIKKAVASTTKFIESDKENVVPDSDDSTCSRSAPPKVVIRTPKKARQPFTEVKHAASQPEKRVIPNSDPCSSLPTPPISGSSTPASWRKRGLTDHLATLVPVTPSKRRKILNIWED